MLLGNIPYTVQVKMVVVIMGDYYGRQRRQVVYTTGSRSISSRSSKLEYMYREGRSSILQGAGRYLAGPAN